MSENQMQTLNARIAEKVGKELVDLIDPDDWSKIIDEQVRIFKTDKLPGIVQDQLSKMFREDINNLISSKYKQEYANGISRTTNEFVKETLKMAAPEILEAMLSPVMSGMLQDIQNRLRY